MTDNHQPEIAKAAKEFEAYINWLEDAKWGTSSIDLYIAGMIARSTETMESMFHNAAGAPDNTLAILFRNLFETVIRIRYLAQDPEKRVHEFHLDDVRGRLGIMGENDNADDGAERIAERTKLKTMRDTHKEKVKELFQVEKPPKLSVIRMCDLIGESDEYVIYRLFSQYEHSMGMGIAGSVLDKDTNKVVYGQQMDKGQTQVMWQYVQSQMARIQQAVEMLNSHRPK